MLRYLEENFDERATLGDRDAYEGVKAEVQRLEFMLVNRGYLKEFYRNKRVLERNQINLKRKEVKMNQRRRKYEICITV